MEEEKKERKKSIKANPQETEETERSCTRTKPTNHYPPSPFEISNVRFPFDTHPYHPFIFTNFLLNTIQSPLATITNPLEP